LLTYLEAYQNAHPITKHTIISLFEEGEFTSKFNTLGIEVVALNLRPYFERRRFDLIFKKLFQFIKSHNPDVVETHLSWSRILANTAAFFAGVRVRVGFEQGDTYLNSLKFRILNFCSQFLFNKIICCSAPLKIWVHKTHKISLNKILVLENSIDLSKFSPVGTKNFNSEVIETNLENPFVFWAVGTLGSGVNKRVDIIMEAFLTVYNLHSNAILAIIGYGEQRSKLELQAENLKVKDRVVFLGKRNDVQAILPHGNAFCHAAPFEPFGIVCIEAMACGLPAIVPTSGGIMHIVQNQINGYHYNALDAKELAKAMIKILEDKISYITLAKNAIDRSRDFDIKNYVEVIHNACYNG
jgi:glycosyltransferase involved in cell wall biosynthesis